MIEGILRGFDKVGNIVLVDCVETAPVAGLPPDVDYPPRKLGTAVVRAPRILSIDVIKHA